MVMMSVVGNRSADLFVCVRASPGDAPAAAAAAAWSATQRRRPETACISPDDVHRSVTANDCIAHQIHFCIFYGGLRAGCNEATVGSCSRVISAEAIRTAVHSTIISISLKCLKDIC